MQKLVAGSFSVSPYKHNSTVNEML